MKIGIFGGAFNPPHIGHTHAAKKAFEQQRLDLLFVIPTGRPPHKNLPEGTPDPEARLLMCENAFEGYNRIIVSDMELISTGYSYTIDTALFLQQEYPGAIIYLLVGNDMYESLNTWKDSEALLAKVTPVLLPRDEIAISSTKIRELLPHRKGREYLADSNYSYIIKYRLYGAKPNWDWLREQAHSMLDPLRIPHVNACEIEALQLAERWGVDPDDAREAAILHDITKKLDFTENLCIMSERGVEVGELAKGEEKLLHSITGSLLAQTEFGVSNAVADAIKWHTTGKSNMSMLEKIIYIADYIESTRDFPGVIQLRDLAYENIDAAMVTGLEMTVNDLISRGIAPNSSTLDAINDLKD